MFICVCTLTPYVLCLNCLLILFTWLPVRDRDHAATITITVSLWSAEAKFIYMYCLCFYHEVLLTVCVCVILPSLRVHVDVCDDKLTTHQLYIHTRKVHLLSGIAKSVGILCMHYQLFPLSMTCYILALHHYTCALSHSLTCTCDKLPYSREIWRALNLANGSSEHIGEF